MSESEHPLLDLWRAALEHQRAHVTPTLDRPALQCPACVESSRCGEPLPELANAHRTAISRYGCGILDAPAIAAIREWAGHAGLVEVGAGTGYNARLLDAAGIDIIATDAVLPGEAPEQSAWQATGQAAYAPIERLDAASAVRRYPSRTLLLIWPSYNDPFAARALHAYTGDILIYVGEYRGCTADDDFHDALDRDWERVLRQPVPTWADVSDYLEIYCRRPLTAAFAGACATAGGIRMNCAPPADRS
jgi:hypothetical protein